MTVVRQIIDPATGQALLVTPSDPTAGSGLDAPLGSLANVSGGGTWYSKTGAAATAWSQLAATSGFLSLSGGSLNAGANLTVPGLLTAQGGFTLSAGTLSLPSRAVTVAGVGTNFALENSANTFSQNQIIDGGAGVVRRFHIKHNANAADGLVLEQTSASGQSPRLFLADTVGVNAIYAGSGITNFTTGATVGTATGTVRLALSNTYLDLQNGIELRVGGTSVITSGRAIQNVSIAASTGTFSGQTTITGGGFTVGTSTLAATAQINLNTLAGNQRRINFFSGSGLRWGFGANNDAEDGVNDVGSSFFLNAYNDATGALIGTVLTVARPAAGLVTWARPMNVTNGHLGIGTTAGTGIMLRVEGAGVLAGTSAYGVWSKPLAPSTATSSAVAFYARVQTAAAAFTMNGAYGMYVDPVVLGAGSAVTNQYGLYVTAMTGATNNYALYTNAGAVSFGDAVTIRANGLTVTGGITGALNGNAATATKLAAAVTINGVSFDGSAAITVGVSGLAITGNALANGITKSVLQELGTVTLGVWNATAIANAYIASGLDVAKLTTGTTLPANITASSLQSVGTLSLLNVNGLITTATDLAFGQSSAAFLTLTRRANYGDVTLAFNLRGVTGADTYITPTAVSTYSGISAMYGGVVQIYGSTAANTAGATVTPAVIAQFAPTGSSIASGLQATLTTAAQPNITSVGQLGSLNVSGFITTGSGYQLNGTTVMLSAGSYVQLRDTSGRNAIFLGNTGDPGNYYDNTTHIFRARDNSTVLATLNASGLAVTLVTAAQPNITSLGTLTSLAAVGGGAGVFKVEAASDGTSPRIQSYASKTLYINELGNAVVFGGAVTFGAAVTVSSTLQVSSTARFDGQPQVWGNGAKLLFHSAGVADWSLGSIGSTSAWSIGSDSRADIFALNYAGGARVLGDSIAMNLQAITASAAIYQQFNNSAGTRRGYLGYLTASNADMLLGNDEGPIKLAPSGLVKLTLTSTAMTVGVPITATDFILA